MIIGIALFFILIALFWLSLSLGNLKQEVEQSKREGAILLITMLAGSPEFNCPDKGVCVDTDKLLALKESIVYRNFWAVEGLSVQRTYPYENKTIECTRSNYPKCNTYTLVNTSSAGIIRDSIYVSLCRKQAGVASIYEKCEIGKIVVATKKE